MATEPTTPETPEPFDATALNDEALYAEYARVKTRGAELSAKQDLSAEEIAEFTVLGDRVDLVRDEISTRETAAAELAARRSAFAALPDLTPPAAPEPPAAVETPAAPEPAAPAVVPSVAELGAQPPEPPVVLGRERPREFSIVLTSDGAASVGKRYGEEVTVADVSAAVAKSFSSYGRAGGGQSSKRTLAQFTRNRGDELQLGRGEEDDYNAIERARKESRLDGGSLLKAWGAQVTEDANSLTAAAGWCAPSENLYDTCGLWSMDGMLDLPTLTASRGGFNYASNQPTYADLQASTSFTVLTEAQVIADTEKSCAEIPCPTFTDARLDVAVSCITASFMQMAGYPEWVNNYVDGLLTNHAHKLNGNIIARIATKAGAATVIPAQGATPAPGSGPDSSATASLLAALETAATDMRYRERMPFSQTFEVILPQWSLAQIRADLSRRNAYPSDPFAITNQMIVGWFATRNIRPQFVYDFQDAYATTPPTGLPGGTAALTALPVTVNFLIYPAGAVVLARQDVVTLSSVYDAANLQQNLFTRLFSEEGFQPIYPCGSIRQYTAQLCPSGATGAQVWSSCAVPAAAA
ncbi:major capsid protein [Streptomyces scopuliridis]|uniref:Major capsid protein n=1 Tax=Streptomyces scopuliridis TaxID=452529 RepID=A0ACD4ZPE5_9ACTN|nr:major capsid protein [Streptomyces scopuliridis]WSC00064.1 major capsid protein [Streptomyces scopuliridis]